jgi:hypothetical protein
MATVTYTANAANITNRTRSTNPDGSSFCRSELLPRSALTASLTFEPSSEVKTFATGDKVHSLPFTGNYTECVPIAGDFAITTRSTVGVTDSSFQYCGEEAGSHLSYTANIGYFVRNSASVPVPTPPAGLQASLKKQADTKACADLRRSLFNTPLIVMERKETVDMLRRKGLQIAAAVKFRQTTDVERWLKTRSADKRRVARDIAGEHLALLFGFLPLISEIEGICGALAGDTPFKITGRGRASDVTNTSTNRSNLSNQPSAGHGIAYYVAFNESMVRFSHRTSVSATVTLSGAQYARDAGFNPLATFYDLVPLSFLSDFVSNLGTFIRALDPLVGVEFLTGNSTAWTERRDTLNVVGISQRIDRTPTAGGNPQYTVNVAKGQGTGFTRRLRVERSVLTAYPDPSLMWVNNLSLTKVGTIASLAIQRYLKPVQRLFAVKTFRYKGPRPKYLPPIKYR